MRWFGIAATVILLAGLALGDVATAAAPRRTTRQQAGAKAAPRKGSAQLRQEWDLGDLKLTREAVDDGEFPADVKSAGIAAVDWFMSQQEQLLTKVDQDPKNEATARKARPALEKEFNQRMRVITGNAQFQAELTSRLKALNKEMDDMADSADRMLSHLDAVGITPAQKTKLRPVIRDANARLKAAASKSASRSVKDKQAREEAAKALADAHGRIKQTLTKAQRDKLAKNLASGRDDPR